MMADQHNGNTTARHCFGVWCVAIAFAAMCALQVTAANAACVGGAPNGVVQAGEQCDDNDSNNNDFCLNNCMLATCGDNIECSDPDCAVFALGGLEECDTGVLRSNSLPNACRTNCQDPGCGDNVTDSGEQCDDGNAVNTDACLNTCKDASCGDGFLEGGSSEYCDDGNAVNTDACKNDCTVAVCGDGVTQTGVEQCDDGNVVNGDFCANNCTLPLCGNGVVQGNEECDDGNTNNNDLCVACKNAICGDGYVAPAENCDDGNAVNTDACKNNCTFAVCGDGVTRAGLEQCDDANASNNDNCKNDCTLNTCGDGWIKVGTEQCDNGGANSNTLPNACRTNCKTAFCGDGVTDTVENCDDGNAVQTDACKNDCSFAVCGDGYVRSGVEGCDDGNLVNGDACTAACFPSGCGNGFVDPGEQCDPQVYGTTPPTPLETTACDKDCTFAACADGTVNATNNEQCDDGNATANDGCTGCPGITDFCGDGIDNNGTQEECDWGGSNSNTLPNYCRTNCKLPKCGDGVADPGYGESCDDGNATETDACHNNCTYNVCGDGVIDTTQEACDDGNVDNTDGCSTACLTAKCGDGIIQVQDNEQCDDGKDAVCVGGGYNNGATCVKDTDCLGICSGATPNPGQPCTAATVAADCGSLSGCLLGGVSCADVAGVNNSDDLPNACRSTCKKAFCGDGVIDSGEGCEGPAGAGNPCIVTNPGGAPSALNCAVASCGDGVVCTSGTCTTGPGSGPEQCDDDNAVQSDACKNDCSLATCGDGYTQTGVEECDNGASACAGGYDVGDVCAVNADCRGICAVGTVNPGAPCTTAIDVAACGNPGTCNLAGATCNNAGNNDQAGGACRTTCDLWYCGDGVVDGGEACDDGNTDSSDACKANCTLNVCGDGVVEQGVEGCDDGNLVNGDACTAACFPSGCGNGFIDPGSGETCDPQAYGTTPPTPLETAACDLDCTAAACYDGTVNATAGEQCDDGNMTANDGCTGCLGILDVCGDGIINDAGVEDCDNGTGGNSNTVPNACRTTCLYPDCGDGVTDNLFGEACDAGGEAATCDDDCTTVSCGDGNVNQAAGEQCDNGVANANAPDACRATNNPPYWVKCTKPKNADGIVDPSIGEICDAGPAGDALCNPNGCSTGIGGFFAGFNGAVCQLGKVSDLCVALPGYDDCRGKTRISKMLTKIMRKTMSAEDLAALGQLARAQRLNHSALRMTVRLDSQIQERLCAESPAFQDCTDKNLGELLVDIMTAIEDNLEAITP